jgi:hypothetical protein
MQSCITKEGVTTMHTLTHWIAQRSGPRITVHGTNEAGERVKIAAMDVQGPSPARMCEPTKTIAVQPSGDCVILA